MTKGAKPHIVVATDGIETAPAPAWLSVEAREEWDRVVPLLIERRVLTKADLGGLENYAVAMGRVRQAEAAINLTSDPEAIIKLARMQDKAIASARQLAALYGLTPVDRSRPTVRDAGGDDEDSPLHVS